MNNEEQLQDLTMDVTDVRTENGVNKLKCSQRARFASEYLVDLVQHFDVIWRKFTTNQQQLQSEMKKIQIEIGKLMKNKKKEEAEKLIVHRNLMKQREEKEQNLVNEMLEMRDKYWSQIGNIVHHSVPISNDEKDNIVVKKWGTPGELVKLHHSEVLHRIDGYNMESGINIAGHRSYFLKGLAVILNQAIINYAIHFLTSKKFGKLVDGTENDSDDKFNYQLLQTPLFMNQDIMAKTAQLSDFDEQLYKVTGNGNDDVKYLIATSEQPISGYHMNEWINEFDLPKRYLGYSTCFRKEAGSSGRDLRGIFRVHQFEKVEQFCITKPEDSWKMHEEMLKNSEEFYQSLELPYQVIMIVSGALNNAASKKYDLEAWFPNTQEYRELVSCSNCTDYQSSRLSIRCGFTVGKDKKFVHMLNSTLVASERTLCCILENYQTIDGVNIPAKLQPYCHGIKFIPFVRELPKETQIIKEVKETK